MEDLTALSAATLLKRNQSLELAVIRYGDPDVERKWADVKAELDRRCQIFSWDKDLIAVNMGKTLSSSLHYAKIYIGAPAEFSALLQYFISKPKP